MNVELKQIHFGGISLQIPEIWSVATESYTEPDGRECAMIDISANDGDPRSIVISYGPMPEGSDAIMEAGDTYEELIGEIGTAVEDDPICEYDFLGTIGFGFDFLLRIILHVISYVLKLALTHQKGVTFSPS